ncbi:MAG: LysM peptidoglycan-binding domain-containing protein [Chloroflexota bacterium]
MRRWLSAGLIVLALVLPWVPAQAQEGEPIYIVEPNDTLSDIARRFGVSLEALIQANHIDNPSLVQPGQELLIPGFEGITGMLTTYGIGYGETLASLSMRYGVDVETLVRLNRVVNPARLYVGQEVIVPRDESNPLRVATGEAVLAREGEPLLELAVRQGLNPWLLRIENRQTDRMWLLPGSELTVPGGSSPPSGFPEPVVSIQVTPSPTVQGRTVRIEVASAAPILVEGQLGERTLRFHPLDEARQVALQGMHAMAEPGLQDLELRLRAAGDGALLYAFSQPVRVVEGGYLFDPPLSVPPETIDPAVTAPEDTLIASIVNNDSPERLWSGTFQFPSENIEVFPSVFGSRRSYNNTGYNYYHTGLDFYGSTGTPILAPARGRVVFAGPLSVRGNTTLIDHGWGVFTGYLHQSEILVSVGDMVEPGQTIGLVGATGRVTGAHLHWEVLVGGVPVDPLEWTSVEFP